MAKVLIIGDAQTGALQHRIKRIRDIALASAPGKAFDKVTIGKNGRLKGTQLQLNCPPAPKISVFALIYIYADLPEPVMVLPTRTQRYSSSYLAASLVERLSTTRAVTLARQIVPHIARQRIVLIPKPITPQLADKGLARTDSRAATKLCETAAGFPIAHLKSSIYSVNWAPDPAYYANPADWRGTPCAEDTPTTADHGHLNARGGSRIFDALQRDIAQRLAPAPKTLPRPNACQTNAGILLPITST